MSRRIGADSALNVKENPDALAPFAEGKGRFDIAFEASGSGAALAAALAVVRPRGTIVQIGNPVGDTAVSLSPLLAKEITLRGSFRFHAEFAQAVAVLASGRFDVSPLLTEVVPLGEAVRAFELATDRSRAMKVQLSF
jgi:L-idonate 5-dehydrogenase